MDDVGIEVVKTRDTLDQLQNQAQPPKPETKDEALSLCNFGSQPSVQAEGDLPDYVSSILPHSHIYSDISQDEKDRIALECGPPARITSTLEELRALKMAFEAENSRKNALQAPPLTNHEPEEQLNPEETSAKKRDTKGMQK